ncbi:YdeI/OmpD-associated family protein [Bizionia sp.]|uniref:YdeI/OmpD-associated family protein n=1 Tax=Bizionia sp. TaxID=1954480 RepID=UPI003A95C2D1
MKKANSVEDYIESHEKYKEALNLLRKIILKTDLKETLKWHAPVYTWQGKNVLGLGAFKNHFGIWFFNGVFLKDEHHLLEQAQEKTKGLRQMRFESVHDINKDAVLSYVKEAIKNQKEGKEITASRKGKTVQIPKELEQYLKDNPTLKSAFMALTPGRQREYSDYIESAKRDATKQTRLEKVKPLVLEGKGLYDKYKDC